MKPVTRVLGAVFVAGGAFWVFTFGSFEQEVRQSLPGGFPLPAFQLPVLDSGLLVEDTTFLNSRELEDKVLLVTFWATWCSPCIAEQPSLLALQEEFSEDGLRVIGILHRDDPEKALNWLQVHERPDLLTLVGTTEFVRAIRVGGIPHTLLVDRTGEVLEIFGGWWKERDPYIRKRVKELIRS